MGAPVETKVKASTTVAAVSGMALWLLGKYVFKGSVPDVVASWTYVLVPGVLTFAAGYFARHTPRTLPVSQFQVMPSVTTGSTGTVTFTNPPGEPPAENRAAT